MDSDKDQPQVRGWRALSKRGQWIAIGLGVFLIIVIAASGGKSGGSASSSRPTCDSIVSDVKSLSTEKGPEIFEINEIVVEREWTQAWPSISCRGVAETSSGPNNVVFGTEVSPQGATMLTLEYPNGVR